VINLTIPAALQALQASKDIYNEKLTTTGTAGHQRQSRGGEEHLLTERGQRIRDVRQGNDGSLYIVTDEANGELWRITPKQ
jgi:glucose/arabinose dehydrogenase